MSIAGYWMTALRCAFVALFATFSGGAGAQIAEVSIGIVNAISDTPLVWADKKGYFADEGIKARIIGFDGGARMIAPLGSGELDVGAGAPSAGFFNAFARDIQIRMVADKSSNSKQYNFKTVMVRKALWDTGRVRSLKDLKGLKVGIGGGAGGLDYALWDVVLASAGIAPRDSDVTAVNFPQQPMALQTGAIDVSIVPEPYVAMARKMGAAVELAPIADLVPMQQTGVILYGKRMLENREIGVRFMKAYLRAVRDWTRALQDGRLAGPGAQEIIDLMVANRMVADPAIFRDIVPNWVDPDGRISIESLELTVAYFKREKLVADNVSLAAVIDTGFLDEALRRIGRAGP